MKTVELKIYLKSSTKKVFEFLNSTNGREKFWAERAPGKDGIIHFTFPNGESYSSKILRIIQNREFHIDYFNSYVKFFLVPAENNGTDLTLINEGIEDHEYLNIHSGWVSVLLNLKAAADCNCDLRNHNKNKTWDQKYVDN
jgi:hypothetical protein